MEQPGKPAPGATSLLMNLELSQQPQEFGYCRFPSKSRELQVHKAQRTIFCSGRRVRNALCWGHPPPFPYSHCIHRVQGADAKPKPRLSLELGEWCFRGPIQGSQAHHAHHNYRLGNPGLFILAFACGWGSRLPRLYSGTLCQLSGNPVKAGRSETKASGKRCQEVGFSDDLYPTLYLVGLLPAAGLSVHVDCIFGPVSFNVELLSNLRLREVDTKGREQQS